MSLDYVNAGEAVRSSTINSLIDAVGGGGNQSPDLIFTGTPNGPQVVAPTQMGNSDIQRQCMFDVRNYILSGWPMAQIQLGFSLQDALESVKVHDDEGATNAASAVMIFKNSPTCPIGGGTISGYVLSENDFASQGYNNTGWVKTSMEGVFGKTSPRLQVWKTDDHVYEVIANTNYDETRQKLSSVLSQSGVEAQELSTMKMLQDWRLLYQTETQSGGRAVPTGRTQMKNGQVDVYDLSPKKNWRAMLKAFLGCYSVSNGEGEGRTSNWTWIIPMGPGADYKEASEGVWSTQFTYGGDPVIVKAEPGTLDANYDGSAIWIEDSDFGGDFIAFGKFTTDDNGEIEPGNLWLDLSYDAYKYAVVGELNDGSGDPPESEAILGTAIRIAGCEKYKARDDVKAFDEAHPSYVFSGTVGDLFNGTPKLDTYSQAQPGVQYTSLNWTTRGKDEEEQYAGGVTCRCMQIKDFDSAQAEDPDFSSDLFLARRFDSETSSASLVYVPLSTYELFPDSELSGAETSSLQWRVISSDVSGEGSALVSVDTKVLEAWNFHQLSDVYEDLPLALSGGEQHVMLRNATSGLIEYVQLSSLSVLTDSQGMSDQKSIDWLSSDVLSPRELQIYGFDSAEADSPTSADMYIVRRSTDTGPQVVYLPISSAQGVFPDSTVSSSQTSSLQWRELRANGQEDGDVSAKVLQIYGFDAMNEVFEDLSDALSGERHVILRSAETSAVEYIQLSALSTQVQVDSEYDGQQNAMKSIQLGTFDGDDRQYVQLYGFTEELAQADHVNVQLSTNSKPLLGPGYEFVVRKTDQNGDRTIEYKSLSAACLSGGGGGGKQLPGPFEMELSADGAATFTNCVLRIARAYFFFQDQNLQVPPTDQIIYVRSEHTDPPTISVECGDYSTVSYNLGNIWSNCLSTTITPLYRTLSGDVKCDYRYMMNIQAYDARNYSNSI